MTAYSGLKSDFMERTNKAFNRFQKDKVPFSALRLGISGSQAKKLGMDRVVEKHLRQTDEILGKSDNNYAILMEGTSFDAAIEASKRLANGLLNLKKAKATSLPEEQWNASFEIIGCRNGSDGLCRTFLELNNSFENVKEKKAIPRGVKVYLQNSETMVHRVNRSQQTVNITV